MAASDPQSNVNFKFLSTVAHELKAPVAAIEGYLRIIRDQSAGADPKVYQDMLDRCIIRSQGMRELIVDMLNLAHLESGPSKRNLVPVDLAGVAVGALDTLKPLLDEHHITISFRHDDSCQLPANRSEMDIIFHNLLTNAIKYNIPGGKIEIDIKTKGTAIVLNVSNTGLGLTDDEKKNMFKEFVRGKTAKTKNIPGTGLGLSILKKIVDLYQGKIEVCSAPEDMTRFTVTLPL
jgi:two-component system, sensor histidine kinase and response regulator